MGPIDYSALAKMLMSQSQVMPVASKNTPLSRGINPMVGTEGARVPSGGGGRAFSPALNHAQMQRAAEQNMLETRGTFGKHEIPLPDGGGLRVVVSKRSGNSRGANRGSHLKSNYVYMEPGGQWKSITESDFIRLLGGG